MQVQDNLLPATRFRGQRNITFPGFAQSLELLKSLEICPAIFQTWKKFG